MRRRRPFFSPLLLLAFALLPLLGAVPAWPAPPGLTIGAGPDSRQQLVVALAALLLEHEGYEVAIRPGLAEAELRQRLVQGEIDLCFPTGPDEPQAEAEAGAVVRLPPFAYAAGPVMLMRNEQAAALGIDSIGQLADRCRATPGRLRLDGLDSATARQLAPYALPIPADRPLPAALLYHALKNNRVDAALGRADDGRIVAFRLRVLADDRKALSERHTAPLIRKETLARLPKLAEVIARLRAHLDDEAIRRLHAGVEIGHRAPRALAQEWLRARKLL